MKTATTKKSQLTLFLLLSRMCVIPASGLEDLEELVGALADIPHRYDQVSLPCFYRQGNFCLPGKLCCCITIFIATFVATFSEIRRSSKPLAMRRAGLGDSGSLEEVGAPVGVAAMLLSPWRFTNPCLIWFFTMRRSNYLKDVFPF